MANYFTPEAVSVRKTGKLLCALIVMVQLSPVSAALDTARQAELLYLLKHDCGSCHGMTLAGGLGPPLTAIALEDRSPEVLEATILHGRPGTPMPPWQGLLAAQEVRWMVRLLKSGKLQ